jgi:hypothetical protein
MERDDPLLVDCDSHGKRVAAVICRHMLASDKPVGVVENSDDPNDLQAWCFACEEKFQAEGEMTASFKEVNDFALVCVACYAEAKQRHTMQSN